MLMSLSQERWGGLAGAVRQGEQQGHISYLRPVSANKWINSLGKSGSRNQSLVIVTGLPEDRS